MYAKNLTPDAQNTSVLPTTLAGAARCPSGPGRLAPRPGKGWSAAGPERPLGEASLGGGRLRDFPTSDVFPPGPPPPFVLASLPESQGKGTPPGSPAAKEAETRPGRTGHAHLLRMATPVRATRAGALAVPRPRCRQGSSPGPLGCSERGVPFSHAPSPQPPPGIRTWRNPDGT